MIHYDTLLQNATYVLQNATAALLQNATEVYYKTLQGFYYKMRQFYDKMRQLLQTILLQNATVITKCDVYFKLRQYTPWNPSYSFLGEKKLFFVNLVFDNSCLILVFLDWCFLSKGEKREYVASLGAIPFPAMNWFREDNFNSFCNRMTKSVLHLSIIAGTSTDINTSITKGFLKSIKIRLKIIFVLFLHGSDFARWKIGKNFHVHINVFHPPKFNFIHQDVYKNQLSKDTSIFIKPV